MASTVRLAASLALVMFGVATARADVTLQNDGFASGDAVQFEGGFAVNEIGASRFVAPDPARQLLKVQLLFGGGSMAQRTITLKVYDDTAGTDNPGTELNSTDFMLSG